MNKQQIIDRLESALSQKWEKYKTVRCPRLKTLAEIINEYLQGYRARISCAGLEVKDLDGFRKLRHNPKDAYRSNYEVVQWILDRIN
jgi:hypothetical protein